MMRLMRSYAAVLAILVLTLAIHLLWTQALAALRAGQTEGVWASVALLLHRLWFFNAALWQDTPAYPGGAVLMFVTYGFVHGNWEHILWNMVPLLPLGIHVTRQGGQIGFLALYFGAMVVAAGVYALTSPPGATMLGGSGAVYGLAGASLVWAAGQARGLTGRVILPFAGIAALVALNLWYLSRGIAVAWTVHLGGFTFGAIMAMVWPGRDGQPHRARAE